MTVSVRSREVSTNDSFTIYGNRHCFCVSCRSLFCRSNYLSFSYKTQEVSLCRTLGENKFPKQFYRNLRRLYEKTESIPQTLDLLLEQYPKGQVAKRLRASKDYLKNSHYKDYETALYRYLSDSDTANVITDILIKDMQKIRRIPCKEQNFEKENTK